MKLEFDPTKVNGGIEAIKSELTFSIGEDDHIAAERIVLESLEAREIFFVNVLGLSEEAGWDTIIEVDIFYKYAKNRLLLTIDEVYNGGIDNFDGGELSPRYEPQNEDYFSEDHVVLKSDEAKELFFDEWIGVDDEDGDVEIYDLIDEIDIKPEEELIY